MPLTILFSSSDQDWQNYAPHLETAFTEAGLDAQLTQSVSDPAQVDYIVFSPNGPLEDFQPYTNTRAVLGLWAGVEGIVGNTTLTQPLVRMVDTGLTEGMVEWVTGHVLRYHLGLDGHIQHQDGIWRDTPPPLARERQITILGLGALGGACATTLQGLNFNVTGWSRTLKDLPGVRCLSGEEGLRQALSTAEILILLLPLTHDTTNLINRETLAQMPKGAVVINPGRGPMIDDEALVEALDNGQLSHATLDVFRTEPLPAEHPFWAHPRVTVTPHIASSTRPNTAARTIAQTIKRDQEGEPLQHVVDRERGY